LASELLPAAFASLPWGPNQLVRELRTQKHLLWSPFPAEGRQRLPVHGFKILLGTTQLAQPQQMLPAAKG